jgi:hypothetical protein
MANGFALDSYVPVAERIVRFYELYPDGRISTEAPKVVEIGDRVFLEVRATVLRSPDDPAQVAATAWEPYPGKTAYTRDSEAMNAETSAVGRALGLAGIAVNRSVSTSDEIENRRPTAGTPKAEAKGKVLAAANGDHNAARKAWDLVLPDDPQNVDPQRLEAVENVAAALIPPAVDETAKRSRPPRHPGAPVDKAATATGLAAARAVLEEVTE